LDFRFSLDEAVYHSRIHWENNVLNIEPYAHRDLAITHLSLPSSAKMTLWAEHNMFFGGVHAVGRTETGKMVGAGDFRRQGVAINENLE
jgi:gamma-glutamyltranspeptidase/glutathione hydrolase